MTKFKVTFLLFIFLSSSLLSCGQDFNSNSYDGLGNRSCPNPSDTNLCASLKIIQRSCIGCHTGEHAAWYNFESKQDFIDAGLIDSTGGLDFSPLIYNLKRYSKDGTMPVTPYSLSQADYDTLVLWVETP